MSRHKGPEFDAIFAFEGGGDCTLLPLTGMESQIKNSFLILSQ
jgi:hypothetical protein